MTKYRFRVVQMMMTMGKERIGEKRERMTTNNRLARSRGCRGSEPGWKVTQKEETTRLPADWHAGYLLIQSFFPFVEGRR